MLLRSDRLSQVFETLRTLGDEVGASRPCEAKCEQADDPGEATIQFHS